MAYLSLNEYAAGEYTSFEFAREQSALPVVADLVASGGASSVMDGGSYTHTLVASAAAGNLAFQAQSLLSAVVTTDTAKADAAFDSSYIISVFLTGAGFSNTDFPTGRKVGVTVAMEGSSAANFLYLEGNTFVIQGQTTVLFQSGAYTHAVLASAGQALMETKPLVLANGVLSSAGLSAVNLSNQALTSVNLSAAAIAALGLKSQQLNHSDLASQGIAVVTGRAQALAPARLQSDGKASLALKASAAAVSTALASGSTNVVINGVAIRDGAFTSAGLAIVEINPGKSVSRNMPPALDVVIRPAEDRTAVWKNSMAILKRFSKQPLDFKDYDIDLSPWLTPMGDTIDDVAISVECVTTPADTSMTIDDSRTLIGERKVKLWPVGGTNGQVYKVTLLVTTVNGRKDSSELLFTVRDT